MLITPMTRGLLETGAAKSQRLGAVLDSPIPMHRRQRPCSASVDYPGPSRLEQTLEVDSSRPRSATCFNMLYGKSIRGLQTNSRIQRSQAYLDTLSTTNNIFNNNLDLPIYPSLPAIHHVAACTAQGCTLCLTEYRNLLNVIRYFPEAHAVRKVVKQAMSKLRQEAGLKEPDPVWKTAPSMNVRKNKAQRLRDEVSRARLVGDTPSNTTVSISSTSIQTVDSTTANSIEKSGANIASNVAKSVDKTAVDSATALSKAANSSVKAMASGAIPVSIAPKAIPKAALIGAIPASKTTKANVKASVICAKSARTATKANVQASVIGATSATKAIRKAAVIGAIPASKATKVNVKAAVIGVTPARTATKTNVKAAVIGAAPARTATKANTKAAVIGAAPARTATKTNVKATVIGAAPARTATKANTKAAVIGAAPARTAIKANVKATVIVATPTRTSTKANVKAAVIREAPAKKANVKTAVIGATPACTATKANVKTAVIGAAPARTATKANVKAAVIGATPASTAAKANIKAGVISVTPASYASNAGAAFNDAASTSTVPKVKMNRAQQVRTESIKKYIAKITCESGKRTTVNNETKARSTISKSMAPSTPTTKLLSANKIKFVKTKTRGVKHRTQLNKIIQTAVKLNSTKRMADDEALKGKTFKTTYTPNNTRPETRMAHVSVDNAHWSSSTDHSSSKTGDMDKLNDYVGTYLPSVKAVSESCLEDLKAAVFYERPDLLPMSNASEPHILRVSRSETNDVFDHEYMPELYVQPSYLGPTTSYIGSLPSQPSFSTMEEGVSQYCRYGEMTRSSGAWFTSDTGRSFGSFATEQVAGASNESSEMNMYDDSNHEVYEPDYSPRTWEGIYFWRRYRDVNSAIESMLALPCQDQAPFSSLNGTYSADNRRRMQSPNAIPEPKADYIASSQMGNARVPAYKNHRTAADLQSFDTGPIFGSGWRREREHSTTDVKPIVSESNHDYYNDDLPRITGEEQYYTCRLRMPTASSAHQSVANALAMLPAEEAAWDLALTAAKVREERRLEREIKEAALMQSKMKKASVKLQKSATTTRGDTGTHTTKRGKSQTSTYKQQWKY